MSENITAEINGTPQPSSSQIFARSLIQQYQYNNIIPLSGKKQSRLPDLIKVNLHSYANCFESAYHHYKEISDSGAPLKLTAEWILDNYYLLQQAIQQIKEDLPYGYQQHLPRLVDSPYSGFPRIFALCRSLLNNQNYLLELDDLREIMIEFQHEVPLSMSELWAVPIFLRFGLLEKLAYTLLEEIDSVDPTNLPSLPPTSPEVQASMSEKPQNLPKDQTDIIANIIRSLRKISESNWENIFESISLVDKIFRQDPAGIYMNMDFKTRNLYRGEIEKIAKATCQEEHRLASSVLELCQESALNEGKDHDDLLTTAHIGTYLIGDRRKAFEERIHFKPSLKTRIKRRTKSWNSHLYLGGIFLIALGLITLMLWGVHTQSQFDHIGAGQTLLMVIVSLSMVPTAFTVASNLVNTVLTTWITPSFLPKMDFTTGIPAAFQTLVVIPGMISSHNDIDYLVRQLEIHYLSNPQVEFKFALLSDYADADSPTRPEDESLLKYAMQAVASLNHKYQLNHTKDVPPAGEQRFFLFHRHRLWNPSQGNWMGWERKRGKLDELNRFLRGDPNTSFLKITTDEDVRQALGYIRFVITADADTVLPPGSAARLVGTLAHPLNRARFDPTTGQVTSGYTILQPRVEINPRSANQTWFTRIFAGDTGLDLYTHAVSDIYQDLFGEGNYVGKGIYDVDAMMQSVEGHIPENTLLSHDLLEGILGRAGLVSDISLIEDYPQTYYEQVMRQRRWIRGDWQLIPWLINPTKFGVRFSAIDRWKMLHNLLRSLLSPTLLLTILVGIAFLPSLAWLWVSILVVAFGVPLLTALINKALQNLRGKRHQEIWPSLWPVFMRWVFAIAFLPYEAYFSMDAILITLRRLFFTKRKLLSWTTAEHTSVLLRSKINQNQAWIKLSISAILAVAFVLVVQIQTLLSRRVSILLQMPVLPIVILWILSSVLVRLVNQPLPTPKSLTPFKQIGHLRFFARRTWGFFENFVGPQDHWLPPDHFQETPNQIIAHHTSPSNIGLYLTSSIGAYDLGYLDHPRLAARLDATIQTLEQMERHRGHFLNWYNTQSLEPLSPRYVSTVDSGNLAISLIILSTTCTGIPAEPVFRWEVWEGFFDNLNNLSEILNTIKSIHPDPQIDTIMESIVSMETRIRFIKDQPSQWHELFKFISTTFWQGLSNQLGNLIATVSPLMDLENINRLQDVIRQVEQHNRGGQRIIDELVTWVPFLEAVPSLLQKENYHKWLAQLTETLVYSPQLNRIRALTQAALAHITTLQQELPALSNTPDSEQPSIEEAQAWLKALRLALQKAAANAGQLEDQFKSLASRADRFIDEMDFSFLYDPDHQVFHIGFNLETGQLDNSYYDLLASEARIASLVAISKGQVPQKHWLYLSRPITQVNGDYALLSWSGTMFEYLMPTLYLQSHVNTLLHTSVMTAVKYQRSYAKSKGVPWGISESGFFQFDVNNNYQYRAFGVPGLGFKRGLSDDLVIAPYASLMAIKWAPSAVEDNVQELISHGAFGHYGFYEAIDFTNDRLTSGKQSEVVQEYMSHHQGMILMALVNYLYDDIMVRRVHADPQIQSVELLLQEQIPMGVPLLQPGQEDIRDTRRVSETPLEIIPWSEPVSAPAPQMHLLSNGSFSTLLSNRGGGFNRWKGIDLTRWRADGVLDPWGTWIYIQDMQKKNGSNLYTTWSAAHQPIPAGSDDMQVNFFAHMVVFRRTQNGLISTMEVTVAAEDPLEIRRIHLINNANTRRHLRLTSYGEVVMNQQAADVRHPAYNKLFIESEYIPELNLQIFKRRGRSDKDPPVFLGHMLMMRDSHNRKNEGLPIAHESDRRNFIGREHTFRHPSALQSNSYLTGTTGATLDPIFSLGREVYLNPHDSCELAFLTFAAASRSAMLELVKRYSLWSRVEDAFHESNAANLIWLGRQKVESESLKTNLHLLSALLYPQGQFRADFDTLSSNRLNQAGLWRFGISGDYPIILLELDNTEHLDLLAEVVQAQNFFRTRGVHIDLVVLNGESSSYNSELNDLILRKICQADAEQWLNQRSGIFIRFADQMELKEQVLLKSVASVFLSGKLGSLSGQINGKAAPTSELPQLTPTQTSRSHLPALTPWESQPIGPLGFYNGFGGFSPDGKEYVLHLSLGKTTPAPWVNVIGYPHFGFMVSQSGSQTTWSLNSGENRLSPWHNDPVIDPSGEVLYLRDEETGDLWTPTPQPTPAPNPYRIRHGAGYTIFESESHGLKQELTLFASPNDPVKLIHLKVKNTLDTNRRLTATYYLEWVLGITHADSLAYLIPEYNPDYSMLSMRNPYHPEMGERIAFLMANRTLYGFSTSRLEFLGSDGDLSHPAALQRIGLSGSLKVGSDPCAALQVPLDLLPGGTDEIYFVLGEAKDQSSLKLLTKKYHDPSMVGDAFRQTHAFWDNLLSRIQVDTPDPAANLMLNHWWLYQTLSCRIWGRTGFYQSSGAFGFRDQLQDVLALLNIDPYLVKSQILNAAQQQFEEGDVLHWWHPLSHRGVRTRISDNLLWLPFVATQYVSTTGDTSLWEEKIPFLQAPLLKPDELERYGFYEPTQKSYTLFEHCQRALQKGSTVGAHGLPLIGTGDWNDGFNLVGGQGKGESTWLAWFLVDVLKRFAYTCEQRGETQAAQTYRNSAAAYVQAIEQNAWDGNWYLRAFYDDGTPLGSQASLECQIDAIAQSWAVLSGAGQLQRSAQAMDSVWNRLVRPDQNLCLLFTPPFDQSPYNPGYIKNYPPGVRENGGQYTHAAAWTAWAFAGLGDATRAWHLYDMLNPIYQSDGESRARQYRVEPYVSAADVYSQEPFLRRGGWTWYTGSAAWLYRLGIEGLLGLHKQGESLRIDPVIPPQWDGFSIQYRHSKKLYNIYVHNPRHISQGVSETWLDGEKLPEPLIPLDTNQGAQDNIGQSHRIDITLG
ncbi:MAG: glucoamylase family protein [Anaerolineaceae bacterium]